jgi:hypothetical protein
MVADDGLRWNFVLLRSMWIMCCKSRTPPRVILRRRPLVGMEHHLAGFTSERGHPRRRRMPMIAVRVRWR